MTATAERDSGRAAGPVADGATPNPTAGALRPDDAAWDAFVEGGNPGSYLQLSGWARVKAVNGWGADRILAGVTTTGATMNIPDGAIGAQVLLRRPRPLPWTIAYAPRGPVTGTWTDAAVGAFTEEARRSLHARPDRISHLRIDPEVEASGAQDRDGATRHALRAAGWRPADPIQPNATRIVDLTADEEALWGGLRKKWRQYVNKARASGITVTDADGDALPEFHRIYRETADRAGFLIRTEGAYREIWEAYAPEGRARLLFARRPDGEAVATLFLVRSGTRVVEPYGGMTADGGESRANYLLKWEAIRSSREQGATSYDLWGLATGGIAHFKTGFGGREVRYIGAWDLVLDPLGRQAYIRGQGARVWYARRRHGIAGGAQASAYTGGDAA
jgi:lipid II:glycine glycyltransferase (peptidoglycan interpeptide bridge formation enzyme)